MPAIRKLRKKKHVNLFVKTVKWIALNNSPKWMSLFLFCELKLFFIDDIDRHVPHCRAQKHFHRHSFDANTTHTSARIRRMNARVTDFVTWRFVFGNGVYATINCIAYVYQNNNGVANPPLNLSAGNAPHIKCHHRLNIQAMTTSHSQRISSFACFSVANDKYLFWSDIIRFHRLFKSVSSVFVHF